VTGRTHHESLGLRNIQRTFVVKPGKVGETIPSNTVPGIKIFKGLQRNGSTGVPKKKNNTQN